MMIADAKQREAAIDVTQSCIVQAPAGSGKTELLIQRMLALLAQVERPNQILAITFTRKAAGEMRHRLLEALTSARNESCPEQAHDAKTWQLASQALARQGSDLLRNPAQLAIQTIDSFNASLVRKMPWLSRFGALPELADDADNLYLQAAEQVVKRLDIKGAESDLLRQLLGHLDNQVGHLQSMLVDMLRRRDQWLRHLLHKGDDPRATLEAGLARLVSEQLNGLLTHFPLSLSDELLFCGRFAAANRDDGVLEPLAVLDQVPGNSLSELLYWQSFADLLLTTEGKLRKTVNVKSGFPAGKENSAAKKQMIDLLKALDAFPGFIERLAQIRNLPSEGYRDSQWQILHCLVELLPLLVAELWLVFRARGKTDYAAIALQAKQALGDAENPTELMLRTDSDLQHILVDEFQDTSWLQYELLKVLTSGWQAGDGRSLFLVGDPMQSIYRFREAEVGLFLRTFGGQLGDDGPQLKPLRLSCNFRSQAGIVNWVNQSFAQMFPAEVDIASGAVPLALASVVKSELDGSACVLHPFADRDDQAEAEKVVELVQQAQQEDRNQTVAILVRGRNHLQAILPLLRKQGITYQAQDIDQLGSRPAALDLLNLCKAVLHRADRLSWLTVLRAPWCGLTLADLHALVDQAPKATVPALLEDERRIASLSAHGQAIIGRIWPILQRAISRRGRLSLRSLVEGTWLALGGPICYSSEGGNDAVMFFDLLESLEQGGDLPDFELLEQGLKNLFAAADGDADGRLQVMTIHKAKGLQFDTVILPGLGKSTRTADSPLLRWLEHPEYGLLLAPVAARGSGDKDPVYQLIGKLEKEKQELESARLLYVATTRAISRLHLLGHAKPDKDDNLNPAGGSLLEKLWPVVQTEFRERAVSLDIETAEFISPPLRQIANDWQLPQLSTVNLPQLQQVKSASDKSETETRELIFSGWESESRRHIGTLIHQYLEQLVRFGPANWLQDEQHKKQMISRQLSGLGVPRSELSTGVDQVISAVNNMLSGQKGCWILNDYTDQACELAVTGMVGGSLTHAVIDRTFVTENGVRWIIDYKTSTPNAGESLSIFYQRELEHYRSQLIAYRELMQLVDHDHEIRVALYFPLVDGWCEMEYAEI